VFKKYDQYLEADWGDDYWSDVGILDAIKLLDDFNDLDWIDLEREWHSKTTVWQGRCAQTLSDVESPRVLPVLFQMMASEEEDVVLLAADSLNALASMGRFIVWTPDLRIQIGNAMVGAGPVGKIVLESLLEKVIK